MHPPIAKITGPAAGGVPPPERLFKKLDEGIKGPAIWVSGPGGAGKTHLISSYIECRRMSAVWYQMDRGDTDVANFFYYLGIAGSGICRGKGKPLPVLTPDYMAGLSRFTFRFFEDLFDRMAKPGLLVLENFQEVGDRAPLHRVILDGLTRAPESVTVVIISRRKPPPSFYRLRSSGSLSVIGWEDMQLTKDEFLRVSVTLGKGRLSEEQALELHSRLEGWIAGLVLTLEGGFMDSSPPVLISLGGFQDITKYFVGEIWHRVEAEIRDFLFRTCCLPTMTPSMAEKLTGVTRADRILSYLCDHNLFTFRLDQEQPRYRYHSMFSEFLRAKAVESLAPGQYARLMRSSARVLMEDDQYGAAAELLLEAGDQKGIEDLILNRAEHMIRTGRLETLAGWLDALPDHCMSDNPWLQYWKGIGLMHSDRRAAGKILAAAHGALSHRQDLTGMWLSLTALVNCLIYYGGDVQELSVCIDRFYQMHDRLGGFPSEDIELQVLPPILYAHFNARPYRAEISPWVDRARILLGEGQGTPYSRTLLGALLNYLIRVGLIKEAEHYLSYMSSVLEAPDLTPVEGIWFRTLLAVFQFFTGETRASLDTVEEGFREAAGTGFHLLDGILDIRGACAALSDGDIGKAEKFLKRCREDLDLDNPLQRIQFLLFEGWLALYGENPHQASHTMDECFRTGRETGAPFFISLGCLGKAHCLIQQQQYREARELLAGVLLEGRRMGSKHVLHQAHLALSWLYLNTGERAKLRSNLRKCFSLARENGLFNAPLWRPAVMSRLCSAALHDGVETDHVVEVIRRRRLVPPGSYPEMEWWPWPLRVYTLGRFDMVRDGEPLTFTGKVQKRPLDLLKALIAMGGQKVSIERMAEALWPDSRGDTAHGNLETALYRLRKLLDIEDIIELKGGKLTLNPGLCWVDVWSFETVPSPYRVTPDDRHNPTVPAALALFRGVFLPDDEAEAWTIATRERTLDKYLKLVDDFGTCLEEKGDHERAIDCYRKALDLYPASQNVWHRLLACYERTGRRSEGIETYRRCRKILSTVYGIEPEQRIKTLYTKLRPPSG
ncbi:MAG: hypothetical protein JSV26_12535 [bacterium]|nr:MAG: hypothetical protein JSV26_12535 [bacterium]